MTFGNTTSQLPPGLWSQVPRRLTKTAPMGHKEQERLATCLVGAKLRFFGSMLPEKFGSSADSAWIRRAPVVQPQPALHRLGRFSTTYGNTTRWLTNGPGFRAT